MDNRYDVIVIGAGPGGSSVAALLAIVRRTRFVKRTHPSPTFVA